MCTWNFWRFVHSGVHRSSCLLVKKRNHRTWGWDGEHPWAEKAHVRSAVCAECSASWNLGCVTVTWQLPVVPVENKQPREGQWDSKASLKQKSYLWFMQRGGWKWRKTRFRLWMFKMGRWGGWLTHRYSVMYFTRGFSFFSQIWESSETAWWRQQKCQKLRHLKLSTFVTLGRILNNS